MGVMPWEPYKKSTAYRARSWRQRGSYTCKQTLEHIPDSTKQNWRKGDLIKFENGLRWYKQQNTWEEWFLSDKDYVKFLKDSKDRNPAVPIYAAKQYAIIIGKYRVVKEKYAVFSDYGSVVLMLTGSRKGHVRRYFGRSPFYKISEYPHIEIPDKMIEFSEIIKDHKEDSDKCRNSFVSNIYKKIVKEN
jgi:hypothetical protein